LALSCQIAGILAGEPILISVAQEWVSIAVIAVFGGVAYWAFRDLETAEERNQVALQSGGFFLLSGLAAASYSTSGILLPSVEGLLESVFVATVGGIGGAIGGRQYVYRYRALSDALDQTSEWEERIREAAPLHDVGKIGIPDRILLKDGPLTEEEYEEIKQHPLIGADMLSGGTSDLLQMAERIARFHHERWDGDGYPDGLEGEGIPLEARIVGVVDAFDAMTSDRPYRDGMPVERAFSILESEAGAQFDPRVVQAAVSRRNELSQIAQTDPADPTD